LPDDFGRTRDKSRSADDQAYFTDFGCAGTRTSTICDSNAYLFVTAIKAALSCESIFVGKPRDARRVK
jgi:hypothetical protein